MHFALEGWLRRKLSVLILVGHGGAVGPRLLTPSAETAMSRALEPDSRAWICRIAPLDLQTRMPGSLLTPTWGLQTYQGLQTP